jgi:hypothetical protein
MISRTHDACNRALTWVTSRNCSVSLRDSTSRNIVSYEDVIE